MQPYELSRCRGSSTLSVADPVVPGIHNRIVIEPVQARAGRHRSNASLYSRRLAIVPGMGRWEYLAWFFAVVIVASFDAVEIAWLWEYSQRF
jgi:hypothetical protein